MMAERFGVPLETLQLTHAWPTEIVQSIPEKTKGDQILLVQIVKKKRGTNFARDAHRASSSKFCQRRIVQQPTTARGEQIRPEAKGNFDSDSPRWETKTHSREKDRKLTRVDRRTLDQSNSTAKRRAKDHVRPEKKTTGRREGTRQPQAQGGRKTTSDQKSAKSKPNPPKPPNPPTNNSVIKILVARSSKEVGECCRRAVEDVNFAASQAFY